MCDYEKIKQNIKYYALTASRLSGNKKDETARNYGVYLVGVKYETIYTHPAILKVILTFIVKKINTNNGKNKNTDKTKKLECSS